MKVKVNINNEYALLGRESLTNSTQLASFIRAILVTSTRDIIVHYDFNNCNQSKTQLA